MDTFTRIQRLQLNKLMRESGISQKLCSLCDRVQPLSAFHAASNTADGHRPECVACHRARCAADSRERSAALEDPDGWKGYNAAHMAVRRLRGPASAWLCACQRGCALQATQWAVLNHTDDMIWSAKYHWSPDPWCYLPLSAEHHRAYDAAARKKRDEK